MNIVFAYITPFHPNKGGIGRVTDSLTRELQKRGHKIWYLIYDSPITIRHEYNYPAPLSYLPSRDLLSEDNLIAYHEFLKKNDIDIVINQSGNFDDSRLWLNTGSNKAKVISVVHTPPIVNYRYLFSELSQVRGDRLIDWVKCGARICLYPKLKREILKTRRGHYNYLLPRTDAVCTLSEHFFDEIDWLCHGYQDKYFAINNPNSYCFDNNAIPSIKKKRIVWVGLFSEQKRPTQVIRIWKKLYKDFPDWELDIVGYNKNFGWNERMKKLASGLPRINLVGYQDPVKYQKEASIAILTSSYEGWGMVLTEAMQCGAVPVAFDSFASVKDIIEDGKNGLLVKPFCSKDFADKLAYLMSHPDALSKMSENALQSVRKFDIEPIADRWEELFHTLIEN